MDGVTSGINNLQVVRHFIVRGLLLSVKIYIYVYFFDVKRNQISSVNIIKHKYIVIFSTITKFS